MSTPHTPQFRLTGPEGKSLTTKVPLIGWHMAANAALSIVMLVEAGFELEAIGHALARRASSPTCPAAPSGSPATPARRCTWTSGTAPTRSSTPWPRCGRSRRATSIMVFGADGDRDATKRHEMGRVASEGSDILVITDHHPRFEDPSVDPVHPHRGRRTWPSTRRELHEVGAPEQAIRYAVSLAGAGRLDSLGRARAIRTTATSAVCAPRTPRGRKPAMRCAKPAGRKP